MEHRPPFPRGESWRGSASSRRRLRSADNGRLIEPTYTGCYALSGGEWPGCGRGWPKNGVARRRRPYRVKSNPVGRWSCCGWDRRGPREGRIGAFFRLLRGDESRILHVEMETRPPTKTTGQPADPTRSEERRV